MEQRNGPLWFWYHEWYNVSWSVRYAASWWDSGYITMDQTRSQKSPISGYLIVLKTLSQEQQWAEAALPYVGMLVCWYPFVLTRYIRHLGL